MADIPGREQAASYIVGATLAVALALAVALTIVAILALAVALVPHSALTTPPEPVAPYELVLILC